MTTIDTKNLSSFNVGPGQTAKCGNCGAVGHTASPFDGLANRDEIGTPRVGVALVRQDSSEELCPTCDAELNADGDGE